MNNYTVRTTSLFEIWKKLKKNKLAVLGTLIVIIFILAAVFADLIAPYSYQEINMPNQYQPPSLSHLFGTDALGRDLFSRIIYGSRISLSIGFITAIVALLIGVTYGATAGFTGGKTDEIMMRFVDILYCLPVMFFVIMLTMLLGRNFYLLFIAIGAVSWKNIARITRGQIITLKNNEYIHAARLIGLSSARLIFRHLIPNALGPIIVYVTLTIPSVILFESFLSFLGLGVQPPMTSWGSLAAEGKDAILSYPWLILFPGITLTLVLFSLNFLGEGLRDALDPTIKQV